MSLAVEHTNLQVLAPSRRAIRPGDVFVFKPASMPFFFGRVIRTDATVGGFPNGILVYLYAVSSTDKTRVPELRRDELLLPPLATNRLPWSRGYFETVASRPLTESDVLPVHCFRSSTGRCFDEAGNPIEVPVEPMGEFALQSYRSIDDLVSDALGIERAPE
jgi:hypothetical protein